MPGQVVLELQNGRELSTLDLREMVDLFKQIRNIATALILTTETTKCGIITKDGRTISLVAFRHPNGDDPKPGLNNRVQFPPITPAQDVDSNATKLDELRTLITSTSSRSGGSAWAQEAMDKENKASLLI